MRSLVLGQVNRLEDKSGMTIFKSFYHSIYGKCKRVLNLLEAV